MLFIDDVLISDELLTEAFVCNLKACKGACCHEGDYGAPVTKKEISILSDQLQSIKPFLPEDSITLLDAEGAFEYVEDAQKHATTCHEDGRCVFMTRNELGYASCGIEQAHHAEQSDYLKPISCHLYPIRVTSNPELGFESWNYEEWDICSAACTLGAELKVPVYQFVKNAIIRYKGLAFYDQLDAAYKDKYSL